MVFQISEPKNATEAVRQANCFGRALKMEAEGYTVEVNDALESGVCYFVHKADGTTYTVDPLIGRCNCPDFEKHGDYCKHVMYINLWDQKEAAKAEEAQIARYEDMIANGYPG